MGLAICHRLTQLGARATCIGDYNMSNEATIVKDLQKHGSDTEILTTQLNVASSSSVNAWYSRIISKYGALDGVVNSAGVAQKVGGREQPELLGETDEEWERIMGINLNGVFFSTRSAAKAMVALPKAPRSIVNIASLAAWLNSPGVYAYSTSKRAVAGLTPSMAKDLQPFGIRLNTILPCMSIPCMQPSVCQSHNIPRDRTDNFLLQPLHPRPCLANSSICPRMERCHQL